MPNTYIPVHPDRFNPTGRHYVRPMGVVVHTTESGENFEGIEAFLTKPGDRVTDGGRRFGASYDYVAHPDGTRGVCDLGPMGSPYAAPPLNQSFFHIVIPGRAGQSRDEWLDEFSLGCIRSVAQLIVSALWGANLPIQRLTPQNLVEGWSGYCGHVDVSKAFGQTSHSDPGTEFPWDILADEIDKLVPIEAASTEGHDTMLYTFRIATTDEVYARFVSGALRHLGPSEFLISTSEGVPHYSDAKGPQGEVSPAEIANLKSEANLG